MPNRIIREGILSSERVAALDWASEVFYRRLHSVVDDYGRIEAGHQLLRAKCYPLQTDSVRVADIARWMAACQKSGLILVYGVNGKQYLEVCDFGQRVRAESKCPSPPSSADICAQMTANDGLGVCVVVCEDGGGGGKARKRARSPEVTFSEWLEALPEGEKFIPADDPVWTWADEAGVPADFLDLANGAFRDRYIDNPKRYADWRKVFRNAVKGNWLKIWRVDHAGGYVLTTEGQQWERVRQSRLGGKA